VTRTSISQPHIVSGLAAVSWAPGRTDLFGIDGNDTLKHIYLG